MAEDEYCTTSRTRQLLLLSGPRDLARHYCESSHSRHQDGATVNSKRNPAAVYFTVLKTMLENFSLAYSGLSAYLDQPHLLLINPSYSRLRS